ncbi:MAG: CRISPR-associated endonuclease Cas3'', partial [Aquificae bacterium]|nr:CRISPR-associated endonuclease Cas3'' [Aquificota bacterium]
MSRFLLSHPNKPMHIHITNVWKTAVSFFEKEGINDEILKDILTIITFAHDFGKATDYFQQYIKGDKSLKNKPETRHAHIGGLLGFYLVEKYLESKNIDNLFLFKS